MNELERKITLLEGKLKQAEKQGARLKAENQKFEQIATHLQDVVYDIALDGTIKEISPAAENFFGEPASTLIGKNVIELYANPKDRSEFLQELQKKKAVKGYQARFNTTKGERYGSINAALVEDQEKHIIGSIRDITERKRLERQQQLADQILRHDLRSKLQGIIGFSELLTKEEKIGATHTQWAKHIYQNSEAILEMINSKSELDRMEEGTYEPQKKMIDPNQLIKDFDQTYNQSNGYNAKLQLKSDVKTINMDLALIQKALADLVKNALEASPQEAKAKFHIGEEENNYIFTISNKGAIPKQMRAHIYKIHKTSKHDGSGIGCYSAKLRAKTHGGTLTHETSDEEDKTTFYLRIPKNKTAL